MGYLLTILIPTKNRLRYLMGALNCINSIRTSDIEVIVQDNSDNWLEVFSYIKSLNNDNIKFFHQDGKLSQTENSELAAEKVTGEYVSYIGDDDTICESLLLLASCMHQYQIDAAVYGIANYNWPDLLEAKPELNACTYREVKEIVIERYNPYENLIRALHLGMLEIKNLPRVYHGIISKKLFDRVKENAGSYFPGPSPDMANATVCALFAENLIRVNLPMIIDGYGKTSAGGMGQRKMHTGTLKGNFQLKDDVEELWDARIPKLWMQDTIWPNSAMKALEACGRKDLMSKLNYNAIYCDTYLHNKDSLSAIQACNIKMSDYIKSFKCFLNKCVKKLKLILKSDEYHEIVIHQSISIEEAFKLQNQVNSRHDLRMAFENFFD